MIGYILIANIIASNGFNSIEYYSETFRKIIGVNPYKYKKFVNRDINISKKDIETILKGISTCTNLKILVDSYMSRRKPSIKMVKEIKKSMI